MPTLTCVNSAGPRSENQIAVARTASSGAVGLKREMERAVVPVRVAQMMAVASESTAACLALQRAIENAGSLKPDKVRDSLASLDVMTFFGRLKFDPTRRSVKLGRQEIRLTQQQTALVLFLAQGSKSATARDLIEAGLFRSNAAHSTVHSALLTLRRRLDEVEPGLGQKLVRATPRGYHLVTPHE